VLGREIDGPSEVTLRAPPPIDTALALERDDTDRVTLRAGDIVVADAARADVAVDVPAPVSWVDAEAVAAPYDEHLLPECFVCGPARAPGDGLRLFMRPVPGRDLLAAPFTPLPQDCDGGVLRPEIVWSYLDCPSGLPRWITGGWQGRLGLLGRLAARVDAPLREGERYVAMGWILRQEGRKGFTASALVGEDGAVHAVARATWIQLRSE
jgi:hypothetical protein